MQFREVWAALRRAWWMPAVGLILGAAVALTVSLVRPSQYTTESQFFVSTTDSTSSADAFQGSQFSQQRVASYAELLTGERLAARIIDQVDLDLTPEELAAKITATGKPETVLLDVSVTDSSPERAQQIALALQDEFPRLVAELETPEAGEGSPVKVTVVDDAEVPTSASSLKLLQNLVLGALSGLVIGAAGAILRARLDQSVHDVDEAARLARAPVLGAILRDDALARKHLIDRTGSSGVAEAYRRLRTNLQYFSVTDPPETIMVSSPVLSEGKTTLVVNLAFVLAEAGHSVVVLEADLRRPMMSRYLGLPGETGLTDFLSGSADVRDVVQTYGANLFVIPAGQPPPNPAELLASEQLANLVEKLRGTYDYILVDAPPVLPVIDAARLAVVVDGVLLSVRYGSTRKEQLRQAAASLQWVGAKTLGVVLNLVPPTADIIGSYGLDNLGPLGPTGRHHRES